MKISTQTMQRISLRNLAAHKIRLALTVLSVVLGTAFIAGSFVFTDTLQKSFDAIFADTAKGVDVRISAKNEQSSGVPIELVTQLQALPEVQTVAPAIGAPIVLLTDDGEVTQGGGAPSIGQSYLPPEQNLGDPLEFLVGSAPSRQGQIAINSGAAKRSELAVGDKAKVLTASTGFLNVDVTGIYSDATDSGGFIGVLFEQQQAFDIFTDGNHVGYIDVAGKNISATDLKENLLKLFPDIDVNTGDEVRATIQSEVKKALGFINYVLLAFGAIALVLGTFIIYNTFSMLVAQRLRELALLRAIGSSRAQIGFAVVFEALFVGLLGSILGIFTGVGLTYGLRALLNVFDVGLPNGPLQLQPRTIIVALLLGILVTVISAYIPALRAARVPPVAAMREEFASTGNSLVKRTWMGAVVFGIGLVIILVGASGTGGDAAILVGVGAVLVITGVLMCAPALSRPIVAGAGSVITRPFGTVGRLARTNAVRNPRRTAATAFALTLGLMLVTTIAVIGASAKASVNSLVDNGVRADFILSGPRGLWLPLGVNEAVKDLPGIANLVAFHTVNVTIDDDETSGTATNGPLDPVLSLDIIKGSVELSDTSIIVSESYAQEHNWDIGSNVDIVSVDDQKIIRTVSGIYVDNELLGQWLVNETTYSTVTPAAARNYEFLLAKAQPGADLQQLRDDLEDRTDKFYIVQVQDREEFKGQIAGEIDGLLSVIYALLALAIVISILGIINTLALAVVERQREIGMLRAIGMQRNQIRRIIYLESFLIAIFGALTGLAMGLLFGSTLVRTLANDGLKTLSIPWGQVLVVLVCSAGVGILAALWPAVRAAKISPLEAITEG
ncbi:MAG: ABC transporter permease [Mycobacteriaceae bacterium]